jgi:hypothetical protein
MNTRKTRGYVLTFRCINCGRHEVFADYPSEGVEPENRIRGRIYKVTCYSCGWSGDACGVSAIGISHTDSRVKAAGLRPSSRAIAK